MMKCEHNFAKCIQNRMAAAAAEAGIATGGKWKDTAYPHICINRADNFIDGKELKEGKLKGPLDSVPIKYHQGASHLNSSQVMCINFFKKFFEERDGKGETILVGLLRSCGVKISNDSQIVAAVLEYEPDTAERTNFDFYLELDDGSHISFEIKYTESEFGGISPDKKDPGKYERKWEAIYAPMVRKNLLLDVEKDKFYENYQINRNIAYAGVDDQVVFLTLRANDAKGLVKGRKYIDKMHEQYSNIQNLYWEDVVKILLEMIKGDSTYEPYFKKFNEKYISVLR